MLPGLVFNLFYVDLGSLVWQSIHSWETQVPFSCTEDHSSGWFTGYWRFPWFVHGSSGLLQVSKSSQTHPNPSNTPWSFTSPLPWHTQTIIPTKEQIQVSLASFSRDITSFTCQQSPLIAGSNMQQLPAVPSECFYPPLDFSSSSFGFACKEWVNTEPATLPFCYSPKSHS